MLQTNAAVFLVYVRTSSRQGHSPLWRSSSCCDLLSQTSVITWRKHGHKTLLVRESKTLQSSLKAERTFRELSEKNMGTLVPSRRIRLGFDFPDSKSKYLDLKGFNRDVQDICHRPTLERSLLKKLKQNYWDYSLCITKSKRVHSSPD